jgi:mRNA interferase RelE/StbE
MNPNIHIYSIKFTKLAKKQFLKLDKKFQERIKQTLLRIRIRPYSYVKKLIGSTAYRLRVGNHRIIMDIQDKRLMILILKIKHRRAVYKNL